MIDFYVKILLQFSLFVCVVWVICQSAIAISNGSDNTIKSRISVCNYEKANGKIIYVWYLKSDGVRK